VGEGTIVISSTYYASTVSHRYCVSIDDFHLNWYRCSIR
jgi:hypothetical protein